VFSKNNTNTPIIYFANGLVALFTIVKSIIKLFNMIRVPKNKRRDPKVEAMLRNIRNALYFVPIIPAKPIKKLPKHGLSIYRTKPLCQVFLFTAFFLASCASAPTAPPDWVVRGVEAVYPRNAYIAQEGRGPSREQAETDALAAIARYCETQVAVQEQSQQTVTSTGANSARLDSAVFVQSAVRLFALRYAAPWYNPREKTWYTVAHIDRAEAWLIYEPQVKQQADAFRAAYSAAGGEKDPLKQVFRYGLARGMRDELNAALNMARLLAPKPPAQFDDVSVALSRIDVQMESAKTASAVFVDAADNTLKTAASAVFADKGIPVAQTRSQAPYVCAVALEENMQKTDAGTMYTPALNIVISGNSGPLFSYSARLERVGAQNPEVARRRAYNAAANAIQSEFVGELEAKLSK
jgi:hypothetical protein